MNDLSVRAELARQVLSCLETDFRVSAVEVGGSLRAETGGDPYSDVDVKVCLNPGVIDRHFAEDVPNLLAPIGPLLAHGWGVRVLPAKYVQTLYFADYPLFWHVDIGCLGGDHVDGSDLLDAYHWPRLFKTWHETLKGLLRGRDRDNPNYVEEMLGRWLALPPCDPSLSSASRLAVYLDLCAEQTRAERAEFERLGSSVSLPHPDVVENFYRRCDALRLLYLIND